MDLDLNCSKFSREFFILFLLLTLSIKIMVHNQYVFVTLTIDNASRELATAAKQVSKRVKVSIFKSQSSNICSVQLVNFQDPSQKGMQFSFRVVYALTLTLHYTTDTIFLRWKFFKKTLKLNFTYFRTEISKHNMTKEGSDYPSPK